MEKKEIEVLQKHNDGPFSPGKEQEARRERTDNGSSKQGNVTQRNVHPQHKLFLLKKKKRSNHQERYKVKASIRQIQVRIALQRLAYLRLGMLDSERLLLIHYCLYRNGPTSRMDT